MNLNSLRGIFAKDKARRNDSMRVYKKYMSEGVSTQRCISQKDRSRRAFTLIELSIVIFIIGILAAISYPNMTRIYYDYQLEGTANVLASDLRFTLNKALSNKEIVSYSGTNEVYINVRYGILFSDEVTYTIYSFSYNNSSNKWQILTQLDVTQTFPAGVVLNNFDSIKVPATGKYTIIYDNNGIPNDLSGNTLVNNKIELYSSFTGTLKKIVIDLNTGKPRLE